MAHFAQIDENNVVQHVLVIEQAEIDTGNWGDPTTWVQTSYNTRGGVYYTPNTDEPDPDQSKALHKNYAGVGCLWDGVGFFSPQPFPSWTKDSFTYQWNAPTPPPEQPWPEGVIGYQWDEESLSWIEFIPPPEQP
jgi:hypothetical protein